MAHTRLQIPPTGEQFEIGAGAARAVVTEVGATLRSFEVDAVPYCETFALDERPPQGSGAVLVPWPNRVRDGRWHWQDQPQQLGLTEPAAGNAIHGLLRHVCWRPTERTASSITLAAVVPPQPGWPVALDCEITYQLDDAGLSVTHRVVNLGPAAVPFGVGNHPYLRVGATDTDDLVLTLAASTVLPLDERQLPGGPAVPVQGGEFDFRQGRGLVGLRLDTAFGGCVPAPGDDRVRHRLDGPAGGLELWADPAFGWVQVFTPDDHGQRGRAVAVEPMTCPPDALNSGVGLITLDPGAGWAGGWGLRPQPAQPPTSAVPDRGAQL